MKNIIMASLAAVLCSSFALAHHTEKSLKINCGISGTYHGYDIELKYSGSTNWTGSVSVIEAWNFDFKSEYKNCALTWSGNNPLPTLIHCMVPTATGEMFQLDLGENRLSGYVNELGRRSLSLRQYAYHYTIVDEKLKSHLSEVFCKVDNTDPQD